MISVIPPVDEGCTVKVVTKSPVKDVTGAQIRPPLVLLKTPMFVAAYMTAVFPWVPGTLTISRTVFP